MNPFDTLPEEGEQIKALRTALNFAQGFQLFFVVCNNARHLQELLSELSSENATHLRLSLSCASLYDQVKAACKLEAQSIFVSGIDAVLSGPNNPSEHAFISNLNATRNSFIAHCSCPLILGVGDYGLQAIANGAPDLFSIRSGVYHLPDIPQKIHAQAQLMTSEDSWRDGNLSFEEKQERLASIESLLAKYQSLPETQRNYNEEMLLSLRAGTLFSSTDSYERSRQFLGQSLTLARDLEDQEHEAEALLNIGKIYLEQKQLPSARENLEQSLKIYRAINSREREGSALVYLGNLHLCQDELEQAQSTFQQALEIFQGIEDLRGEAVVIGNLSVIRRKEGHYAEALEKANQALKVFREMGDYRNEGNVLSGISANYFLQGRIAESLSTLQQTLQVARRIGYRQMEVNVLSNIGSLYGKQGILTESLVYFQQTLEIAREIGDSDTERKALTNLGVVHRELSKKMFAEADLLLREEENYCDFGDDDE